MTEEHEVQRADEVADGNVSDRHSPDTFECELAAQFAAFQPITGEIEVIPSALKASMPLLVQRSSDPALEPPAQLQQGASQPDDPANRNLRVKPIVTVANGAPMDNVRTEPLGPPDKHSESTLSDLTKKVEFSGDGSPLGVHVVPFNSTLSGRFLGLSIRGIEEKNQSRKKNLLQENECIIKINDDDLTDKTFVQAQEVFQNALQFPAVELQIVPSCNKELYEKFTIGSILSHGHDDDSKTKVPSSVRSKPSGKPADAVYPSNAENSLPPISKKLSSPKQLRSNDHLMHTRKACPPVTLLEEETLAEGAESPEEDGHSHVDTQTPLVSPTPDPPKTSSPAVTGVSV
ncbi:partitioning defective 3 homolog B-like [Hemitrygon akajei]|uniref:partitioning defective 3 homolog B-like n=1 Tax=Hemitrygon akajei TaxID=2704970 RepID=UPI003BFA166A